jgi:subtilase family protein
MAMLTIPPGYIPVLIERSKDANLIAAATAVLTGGNPEPSIERYNQAKSDQSPYLDPSFGAVPIGPGNREHSSSPSDYAPLQSKKFLARAFIKADSSAEISELIDKDLVYSDPLITGLLTLTPPTCGTDPYVGDTVKVRQKLDTATLWQHGLDGSGVALAIVDSGIFKPRLEKLLGETRPSRSVELDRSNSWQPYGIATKPGMHRLGHGTMCAYDALIAAPKATLLDYPMLIARPPAAHTVKPTIAAAVIAYADIKNKWMNPDGAPPPYERLVVSNSWGILHPSLEDFPSNHNGRFIDNPNHALRVYYIKPLTDKKGVDIIFCGNNCGPSCAAPTCLSKTGGMIMGAATYDEVLTVGGCDTNDNLVGYSSHGPSIPLLPNHVPKEKPDITAYTHFLGSRSRRIRRPDAGVSAACPVAAGCVAALRTRLSPAQVPPTSLFQALKQTARRSNGVGPAWNPQYGYGIIDPVAAGRYLGLPIP